MTGSTVDRRMDVRSVIGAQRVGRAPRGGPESAPKKVGEPLRVAEIYEAAETPFRVRAGGVQENASHSPLRIGAAVDALSNRACGVTAVERELADERVRERVQQHVARAWKRGGVRLPLRFPLRELVGHRLRPRLYLWLRFPRRHGSLVELDEDALTSNLDGRQPVAPIAINGCYGRGRAIFGTGASCIDNV